MKKKGTNEAKVIHYFSVEDVKQWESGNVSFTLIVDGFVKIYNCTVIEGKNGDFISFPSRKGSNGKYYNYAYFDLSDHQKTILDLVEEKL